MKKNLNTITALWVMLLIGSACLALSLAGCQGTLAPGGAYAPMTTNAITGVTEMVQAPDLPFFEVELAFMTAHDAAELAFSAERNNRALLWKISPEIKHTLDRIRPQVVTVEADYAQARAVYMANPVPANLDTLTTVLARLQAAAAAASAVMPKPSATNAPPTLPKQTP